MSELGEKSRLFKQELLPKLAKVFLGRQDIGES
jgi:hypothetical protein